MSDFRCSTMALCHVRMCSCRLLCQIRNPRARFPANRFEQNDGRLCSGRAMSPVRLFRDSGSFKHSVQLLLGAVVLLVQAHHVDNSLHSSMR